MPDARAIPTDEPFVAQVVLANGDGVDPRGVQLAKGGVWLHATAGLRMEHIMGTVDNLRVKAGEVWADVVFLSSKDMELAMRLVPCTQGWVLEREYVPDVSFADCPIKKLRLDGVFLTSFRPDAGRSIAGRWVHIGHGARRYGVRADLALGNRRWLGVDWVTRSDGSAGLLEADAPFRPGNFQRQCVVRDGRASVTLAYVRALAQVTTKTEVGWWVVGTPEGELTGRVEYDPGPIDADGRVDESRLAAAMDQAQQLAIEALERLDPEEPDFTRRYAWRWFNGSDGPRAWELYAEDGEPLRDDVHQAFIWWDSSACPWGWEVRGDEVNHESAQDWEEPEEAVLALLAFLGIHPSDVAALEADHA